MRWMKYAAVAVLLSGVATPARAQERQRERPERGARPGFGGVEAALRMREQLKLTEDQAKQLEALRKEIVAQRQSEASEMIDLRSRVEAGLIERDEAREQMEKRRESMREQMEQQRERIERILTDEQREQLRERARSRGTDVRRPGAPPAPPAAPGVVPRRPERPPRLDRAPRPPIPGRYYWF